MGGFVVEEAVDGLLEHAHFVADDDCGGFEFDEFAGAAVAGDDAAVVIVEVAGGEVAALEEDDGAEVWGEDKDDFLEDEGGDVGEAGVAAARELEKLIDGGGTGDGGDVGAWLRGQFLEKFLVVANGDAVGIVDEFVELVVFDAEVGGENGGRALGAALAPV